MKKMLLMLFVGLLYMAKTENVSAQIRHVQGMKSLELSGVYTDLGYGGNLGYLMYLKGNFSAVGLVTYDMGKKLNERDALGVIIDMGAGYSLTTIGNNMFLNVYGGGSLSYDKVEDAEAYPVGNGINYGIFITPEVEYFINDTFSVLGKSPVRYLFANPFGGVRMQGSLGIRYNF